MICYVVAVVKAVGVIGGGSAEIADVIAIYGHADVLESVQSGIVIGIIDKILHKCPVFHIIGAYEEEEIAVVCAGLVSYTRHNRPVFLSCLIVNDIEFGVVAGERNESVKAQRSFGVG